MKIHALALLIISPAELDPLNYHNKVSKKPLARSFFRKESIELAAALLGKILVRRLANGDYLSCVVVETEAYKYADQASHSQRGRKGCDAMFANAGTIYMYKIRQWHSLNISSSDYGGGVLIKGARPLISSAENHIDIPNKNKQEKRKTTGETINRQFSGQGKLCYKLKLETEKWNGKQLGADFYLANNGYHPKSLLVTPRLGVTGDRHLPYRFVDANYLVYATLPGIRREWLYKNIALFFASRKKAVGYAIAAN